MMTENYRLRRALVWMWTQFAHESKGRYHNKGMVALGECEDILEELGLSKDGYLTEAGKELDADNG